MQSADRNTQKRNGGRPNEVTRLKFSGTGKCKNLRPSETINSVTGARSGTISTRYWLAKAGVPLALARLTSINSW